MEGVRRRAAARLCGLMVLAAAVWAGAGAAQAWSLFTPGPRVGKPAPAFTARLFSGEKVSLADYRGKVLILNFWAVWCGPCKRELPLLDAYYRAMEKNGLRIIAVTTDNSVSDFQLKPLAKSLGFPLAHGISGPYAELDGVPTNFVIDRAGVVRYAKAAAFDLDALNAVLVPLLREPPPADVAAPVATAQASPPRSLP